MLVLLFPTVSTRHETKVTDAGEEHKALMLTDLLDPYGLSGGQFNCASKNPSEYPSEFCHTMSQLFHLISAQSQKDFQKWSIELLIDNPTEILVLQKCN